MTALKDMRYARELALKNNGTLLSNRYTNSKTKMLWRCQAGHQFELPCKSVKAGHWCSECNKKDRIGKHWHRIDGIEQGKAIAQSMGGELISDVYQTASVPMHWKCINNHQWTAALADIKKGTWCPLCNNFQVRERHCRMVIEAMFGDKFPKSRPLWLINDRGNRMEFDGFCESKGIAIEYHGEYHYCEISHFHRTQDSFIKRQLDDSVKRRLCRENGVFLVEVPYTIKVEDTESWIIQDLETQGYDFNENKVNRQVQIVDNSTYNRVSELKEKARVNGGECLNTYWAGVAHKYEFRCGIGHVWFATAANILNKSGGTWCPKCVPAKISKARIDSDGLDTLKLIAKNRLGELLSPIYLGVNLRHQWRCKEGHEWWACPTDIKKGTWCKICSFASKRRTIQECIEIAHSRGGLFLSEEYTGNGSKYLWKCKNGHEWSAVFGNVKNGSWCPRCSRKGRKNDNAIATQTNNAESPEVQAGHLPEGTKQSNGGI